MLFFVLLKAAMPTGGGTQATDCWLSLLTYEPSLAAAQLPGNYLAECLKRRHCCLVGWLLLTTSQPTKSSGDAAACLVGC